MSLRVVWLRIIDRVEIYIFKIFAEITMHFLIRGIRDKQFDAILNYHEFIN